MPADYSFIILTHNEGLHLPRLFRSIEGLDAEIYVLDSGSTDHTLEICRLHQVNYTVHPFESHPKQWHYALSIFPVKTPWVIGLDADQIICPDLYRQLKNFKDKDHLSINGIYFNRKYIFKDQWIKHGGHYPKYLLKMFRYRIGYSDLSIYMDHKFIVPGNTLLWKKGHLIEENLKEHQIGFWIDKHSRYSDLLAEETAEKTINGYKSNTTPRFLGQPDEHMAWQKRLWHQLPPYIRVFLYFIYRMVIQKGILDGKTGILYHFLQGFWFRLIVDLKTEEILRQRQISSGHIHKTNRFLYFPVVFLFFYAVHLTAIGITSPGGFYNAYLDEHFNYIRLWRDFDIRITAAILGLLKYQVSTGTFGLHVAGKAGFKLVYSCLGYGIISLFSAFVLCYRKPIITKLIFLFGGILCFQSLNICRFILLALYWNPTLPLNLHFFFNLITYGVMIYGLYLWTSKNNENHRIKKSFL